MIYCTLPVQKKPKNIKLTETHNEMYPCVYHEVKLNKQGETQDSN